MLIYTRIVLVLAAVGLITSGLGGLMSLPSRPVQGLLALILAVGIGYFWIQDWKALSKCIKRAESPMSSVQQ